MQLDSHPSTCVRVDWSGIKLNTPLPNPPQHQWIEVNPRTSKQDLKQFSVILIVVFAAVACRSICLRFFSHTIFYLIFGLLQNLKYNLFNQKVLDFFQAPKIWYITTLWYIWKARNDKRFSRRNWTPCQVHHAVATDIVVTIFNTDAGDEQQLAIQGRAQPDEEPHTHPQGAIDNNSNSNAGITGMQLVR